MPTIDRDALTALDARARRQIDDGALPSCSYALALDGEVVHAMAHGEDATPDTRYAIFSCTKPIVASVIWQLLADDRLHLERPVADVFTEFADNDKGAVTLEHVLLHTCGFPRAPLGPTVWADRDARIAKMASWRLTTEPGTTFEYHASSAHWVLAELIERVCGRDWRHVLHEQVTAPLGLRRLVGVPPEDQDGIAVLLPSGDPPDEDELARVGGPAVVELLRSGEVSDESLLKFNDADVRAVGVPGAGGIATPAELALFYQGLLHNPDKLWDPAVLADATGNVRVDLPDVLRGVTAKRTIGLIVAGDDGGASRRGFGDGLSPRAYGHEGAAGQVAWADPDSGLSFVFVTNGLDRNPLRSARLTHAVSTRAAACVSA